jgi:hypothetical protein
VVFAASQAAEEATVGEVGPIPTFKQGIRFDTFDLNFCKVKINSNLNLAASVSKPGNLNSQKNILSLCQSI